MRAHLFILLAGLALVVLTTRTAQAELHLFALLRGPLNAEVVGMDGSTVFLQAQDGHIVRTELAQLSPPEQQYVTQTLGEKRKAALAKLAQQTVAKAPSLEVTWTKERTNPFNQPKKMGDVTIKSLTNTYVLHLKVFNRSPQETGDMELHYQICYGTTDTATGGERSFKTALKYRSGMIPCPSIAAKGSVALDTQPFNLTSEDPPGGFGSSMLSVNGKLVTPTLKQHKEDFKGIIATFKRADGVVFEYVSPGVKKEGS